MKPFFTILIILLSTIKVSAFVKDTVQIKQVIEATRINQVVNVDGNLDENFWKQIKSVTQFTQHDPDEGKQPTEATEVKIAYDDNALYVGAIMHDISSGFNNSKTCQKRC